MLRDADGKSLNQSKVAIRVSGENGPLQADQVIKDKVEVRQQFTGPDGEAYSFSHSIANIEQDASDPQRWVVTFDGEADEATQLSFLLGAFDDPALAEQTFDLKVGGLPGAALLSHARPFGISGDRKLYTQEAYGVKSPVLPPLTPPTANALKDSYQKVVSLHGIEDRTDFLNDRDNEDLIDRIPDIGLRYAADLLRAIGYEELRFGVPAHDAIFGPGSTVRIQYSGANGPLVEVRETGGRTLIKLNSSAKNVPLEEQARMIFLGMLRGPISNSLPRTVITQAMGGLARANFLERHPQLAEDLVDTVTSGAEGNTDALALLNGEGIFSANPLYGNQAIFPGGVSYRSFWDYWRALMKVPNVEVPGNNVYKEVFRMLTGEEPPNGAFNEAAARVLDRAISSGRAWSPEHKAGYAAAMGHTVNPEFLDWLARYPLGRRGGAQQQAPKAWGSQDNPWRDAANEAYARSGGPAGDRARRAAQRPPR